MGYRELVFIFAKILLIWQSLKVILKKQKKQDSSRILILCICFVNDWGRFVSFFNLIKRLEQLIRYEIIKQNRKKIII